MTGPRGTRPVHPVPTAATGAALVPAPRPPDRPHGTPPRTAPPRTREPRTREPQTSGQQTAPPRTAPPQTAERMAEQAEQARQAMGWEIIRLRMVLGLSRDQLAARAGLTVGNIRRWEGGGLTLVNLDHLHALAGALGVTPGALIDAGSTGTRPAGSAGPTATGIGADAGVSLGVRSPFVLLPTWLPGTRRAVTAWRLVQYVPRDLGQRWERAEDTDLDRTVSRPVLDWVSELLHRRATLFGSATELTGQRSWYVGQPHPGGAGGSGSSGGTGGVGQRP